MFILTGVYGGYMSGHFFGTSPAASCFRDICTRPNCYVHQTKNYTWTNTASQLVAQCHIPIYPLSIPKQLKTNTSAGPVESRRQRRNQGEIGLLQVVIATMGMKSSDLIDLNRFDLFICCFPPNTSQCLEQPSTIKLFKQTTKWSQL